MDHIITDGRVIRGYLGVSGNDLLGQRGFEISSIVPNSPADTAGLQASDILLAVNGIPLEGAAQALELIGETRPETILTFSVSRKGQLFDVPVTIAELTLD